MSNAQFDVIVVGSSITSMIEAIHLAREGKKVALVDRQEDIGGVWRLESCFGLDDVETTPHIFLPDAKAYRLISEYLNCKWAPWPLKPKMFVRRNSRFMNRLHIPIGHNLQNYFVLAVVKRWDKPRQSLIKRIRKFTKFMSEKMWILARTGSLNEPLYPVSGMKGLLDEARAALDKSNIARFQGVGVSHLELSDDISTVRLDDGDVLSSRDICLNQHVDIKNIKIRDKDYSPEYQDCSSLNYNLILKDCEPASFNYMIGVPEIYLVSDITDFYGSISEKFPGCRFITTRVGRKLAETKEPEELLAVLKETNVVSAAASVVRDDYVFYARKRLSRQYIKDITRSSGKRIYFLIAGDLGIMDSISGRYA